MKHAIPPPISLLRSNTFYSVHPKGNLYETCRDLLRSRQESQTILCCFSEKETEDLATYLNDHDLFALPYHEKQSDQTRSSTRKSFLGRDIQVLATTTALAHPLASEHIRTIIHTHLPRCIEAYLTDTLIAGRDGEPSESIILYARSDKYKQAYFLEKYTGLSAKDQSLLELERMTAYCELRSCRLKFLNWYTNTEYIDTPCERCDYCYHSPPYVPNT